jgi:hypothetical protein
MTSSGDPAPSQARVGSYRFFFADEHWEWSPEVQRMHGYEPGTVTPTTELVLSHKHPEDRSQVAAILDDIRRIVRRSVPGIASSTHTRSCARSSSSSSATSSTTNAAR